jgi:5-formyltetrahydrofolate cyclo-ligase
MHDIDLLRKRVHEMRVELEPAARDRACAAIVARIRKLPAFRQARHIAAYWPVQGEVDLSTLRQAGHDALFYLPVVHPTESRPLRFARVDADTQFKNNRFGIPEPDPASAAFCPACDLDLVLAPLVAFDTAGHRIGMGAGFYDRTFSFLRAPSPPARPRLIGVGYEFQRIENIEPRSWDVPLDGVVSENAIFGDIDKSS